MDRGRLRQQDTMGEGRKNLAKFFEDVWYIHTVGGLPVIPLGVLRGKVKKKNPKKERKGGLLQFFLCHNIHLRHINIVSLLY